MIHYIAKTVTIARGSRYSSEAACVLALLG